MSREIDGAIDQMKIPDYQRGYYDGYREGFNKAFEMFQKELEKAYLSRPVNITVDRLLAEQAGFKAKGVEVGE